MAIKFLLISLMVISAILNEAKGSLEQTIHNPNAAALSSREHEALAVIKKLVSFIVNNSQCFHNDSQMNGELEDLFEILPSKNVLVKNAKKLKIQSPTTEQSMNFDRTLKSKYFKLQRNGSKKIRETKEQDSKRHGGNYADYGTILYIGK